VVIVVVVAGVSVDVEVLVVEVVTVLVTGKVLFIQIIIAVSEAVPLVAVI
jgi:hypothetical protein